MVPIFLPNCFSVAFESDSGAHDQPTKCRSDELNPFGSLVSSVKLNPLGPKVFQGKGVPTPKASQEHWDVYLAAWVCPGMSAPVNQQEIGMFKKKMAEQFWE